MTLRVDVYVVVQGKGIRRKAKHEPIDVDQYDADTAPLLTDDTGTLHTGL